MLGRILLLSLLVGCADDGQITVLVNAPTDPALDPFGPGISHLSLTARAQGEVVFEATVRDPDRRNGIDFGRIPAREGVSLELSGETASGRVVGYGRASAVDVASDATVAVPIAFRRPFAYTAGGGALLAIDATSEPGLDYARPIALDASLVSAVAALPAGDAIAVVADRRMHWVSTATHATTDPPIELAGNAVDLAVSPDGRWLVAAHAEPEPGVSIVDRTAGTATFVATTYPVRVTATNQTAWVLDGQRSNFFCNGDSTVLGIDLANPTGPPIEVTLGSPAADIAAHGPTNTAVVAVPCSHAVVAVDADNRAPRTLFELNGASAVAIAADTVWASGHIDEDEDDAHLLIANAPIDGGAAHVLAMPTIEERAVATALAMDGQDGLIRMSADLAAATHISALPDGEHMGILLTAGYFTDPAGDDGNGGFVLPSLKMITYEYQLVRLDTGLPAQRLRLSCTMEWQSEALLDDFACARAPGQDEAPISFVPRNIASIYGAQ